MSRLSFIRSLSGTPRLYRGDVFQKRVVNICMRHGITIDDLRGPSRERKFTHPRQEIMYAGVKAGLTRHQIARVVNRDHTTVIHGARQHAARNGLKPVIRVPYKPSTPQEQAT